MVAQPCEYTKNHFSGFKMQFTVHFKMLNFMVYELYLKKKTYEWGFSMELPDWSISDDSLGMGLFWLLQIHSVLFIAS